MSEFDVVKAFTSVCSKINQVCVKNGLETRPRLVAVSKLKPKGLIIKVYNEGQRHFGENYVQELFEKSTDPEVLEKCNEIRWHFIGNLQRNKVNQLVKVPNLHIVETVDSEKLATALSNSWGKLEKSGLLKVMVQVNTSGESEKNGCEPANCIELVKFVIKNCQYLEFIGLMTIGRIGYDFSSGPNPDFMCLSECRDNVCNDLNLDKKNVELSMGMSDDFEQAIELGSRSIRIGTSIFGSRSKTN